MLPNTDRELSADMLPLEIVEAIITDLKSDDNLFEVELVCSSPSEKNGKPGYWLEAVYKTEDGLRMGRI